LRASHAQPDKPAARDRQRARTALSVFSRQVWDHKHAHRALLV
jgi:hypothetical protein